MADWIRVFLNNYTNTNRWYIPELQLKDIVEIVIIAVIVYEIMLWIKNTKAWMLLRGIIMLAAKPIYGVVTDILPLEKTNVGLLICLAASMCAPFFFHSNVVPPSLFVILYGFTSPLSAMTFPLWAERIGQHTGGMASVYPIFRGCYSLGAIALLTLPGLIADKFGTYTPVFLVYFVLSVLSLILIQRALRLAKMEVDE